MNEDYIYTGFFIERDTLLSKCMSFRKAPLARPVRWPHITVQHESSKDFHVEEKIFGSKVHARITGYANDGQNEALKAEFIPNDACRELIYKACLNSQDQIHITLSTAQINQSVNSRYLNFVPLPTEIQFVIELTFSGFKKATRQPELLLQITQ